MAPLTLTLENDCPWKTALLDPEGYVLYDIKTSFQGDTNYTAIRNDRDEIIGTLRWRETLPDEIMLQGSRFKSINSWLKKSLIPMKYDVRLKDDIGRGYVWKGNAAGLSLQLFTTEDKTTPITIYRKSHIIPNPNPSTDSNAGPQSPTRALPTLELTDRAQEIRDLVVVSFVVLEKGRRTEHGNMSARMMSGAGI